MEGYDHKKIEKKWREAWEKTSVFTTPDKAPGKENFYLLVEFPYPSGNLHVGHWYAFGLPDILARFYRMNGKNVLYPIGFDAFGLPAENAAIKNKLNPREWTEKNIEFMTNQIKSMGASFDWSREVRTIDPAYYKWTQWMFLQFFKKGLAYQKDTAVNWCPTDKTVLANEQVVEGKCDRCGAEVVQKQMLQWNLKITDYADRLIDDLTDLDWPEQIKESQRNWIGRSEGSEIVFPLPESGIRRFVLLHGKGGTAEGAWKPWMKAELEKRGYEVQCPQMPNSSEPNDDEQADYVQKNCTLDEHTALVGHSFGGVVALRLLDRGVKLGRVTFVATPFSGKYLDGKDRASVTAALKKGFDFEKVKSNCNGFVAVYDTHDHVVPMSDGEELSEKLDCLLMKARGEESHFNGKKELDVLLASAPGIKVFTTRPDTLFGATYLVLSPEHLWVTLALKHRTVLKNNDEVQHYVELAKKKTELERIREQKDKTGVKLEGVYAINPATKEKIPLYVADYVLATYGTGAVMGVPAHDERDWEFAQKYRLPITQVVKPVFGIEEKRIDAVHRDTVSAFIRRDDGRILLLKWKEYKWLTGVIGGLEEGESANEAAEREAQEETGYRTKTLYVSPFQIESHYFAEHKGEWRSRNDYPILLELENDQKGPLSEEERAKHDTVWMTVEEALQAGMFNNNKLALEMALGRIGAYTTVRYGEIQVLVNSGEFSGLSVEEGKRAIIERYGRAKTTYKLRDWIVSRQRYWGVPIPVIHCAECGTVGIPEEDLPILLPEVDDYLPDGKGKSPLAKVDSFVRVKCPQCGGEAERETDTLDTFVDSSWYFLRYTDPKNDAEFASRGKQGNWMPVDLYSGGAEHTTMHLLYSRFWHKALFDLGLVADPEPYKRRMNRSLILGPDGQKMSKSRGNVVDPDEVVERLGADTVRMYLAFIGPYNEVSSYPWNPDGVVGVRRFLERVFRLQDGVVDEDVGALNGILHRTLKKVGDDIRVLKFNTAISQLMIFLNTVEKEKRVGKGQWDIFLKMLAPFAPFISEELWYRAGHQTTMEEEEWPEIEEAHLASESVKVAVQIDGKTRGEIEVPTGTDDEAIANAARENVATRLVGKKIARVVVVRGRLVNFVLEE